METKMDEISIRVGQQIRRYRKAARWTLQQLADAIHKSRATVCKYERGEIAADVSTLGDISGALQVPLSQMVSFPPEESVPRPPLAGTVQQSPFFQARRLYFYFYDGRYHRLKDGAIDIQEETEQPGRFTASFTIYSVSGNGSGGAAYYTGSVLYSDMLIRFTFVNQYNPLEMREDTDGLLCGISSADLMPCAFRCLATLRPQALDERLRQRLLLSPAELKRWAKLNMLLIGSRGE